MDDTFVASSTQISLVMPEPSEDYGSNCNIHVSSSSSSWTSAYYDLDGEVARGSRCEITSSPSHASSFDFKRKSARDDFLSRVTGSREETYKKGERGWTCERDFVVGTTKKHQKCVWCCVLVKGMHARALARKHKSREVIVS